MRLVISYKLRKGPCIGERTKNLLSFWKGSQDFELANLANQSLNNFSSKGANQLSSLSIVSILTQKQCCIVLYLPKKEPTGNHRVYGPMTSGSLQIKEYF
jgi:hypothetical protein